MVFSKKIVAVGAHPDDIELGCGGTICAASEADSKVVAVILTKGEKGGNPEIRVKESQQALGILGVNEVLFGDFPDAEVPVTHEAVEFLEKICATHKPDTVFIHNSHEIHQDHLNAHRLSLSAFRSVPRILAFETQQKFPMSFAPTYFVDISKYIDTKVAAIQCHLSQGKDLPPGQEAIIRLSVFRGNQVGVPAAEAFEVIKYLEKGPNL